VHEAPIVHGHKGSSAFGWIARAYREGKTLFLDLKDVVSEFAQGVNMRLHPKRSISFYPPNHPGNPTPGKWNINHLAYLPAEGEINPAIKGLPDHQFKQPDEDCITYDFSEGTQDFAAYGLIPAIADLFTRLRETTIANDGMEAADALVPASVLASINDSRDESLATMQDLFPVTDGLQRQIDDLRSMLFRLQDLIPSPQPQYTEPNPTMTTPNPETNPVNGTATTTAIDPAQFSELQSTVATLQTKLSAIEVENAELRQQNQSLMADRERATVRSFVEALTQDDQRKVLPTEVDAIVELAMSIPNNLEIQYGEVKATPRQQYLNSLTNRKPLWGNSPMPTSPDESPENDSESLNSHPDADPSTVKDDRRIRAYCKENNLNPNVAEDYAEAMSQLGIRY
jgi:hypothetical protein